MTTTTLTLETGHTYPTRGGSTATVNLMLGGRFYGNVEDAGSHVWDADGHSRLSVASFDIVLGASPVQAPAYRPTTHISCADTAKLVRARLAERFPKSDYPGVKFSVKSHNGTSIRIAWVNGPTSRAVEGAVSEYRGANFDGMTDLETPRYSIGPDGEDIQYGSRYIFCNRTITLAFAQKVVDAYMLAFPGNKRPELLESYGDAYIPYATTEDYRWGESITVLWQGLDSRDWQRGFVVTIEHGQLEALPVA